MFYKGLETSLTIHEEKDDLDAYATIDVMVQDLMQQPSFLRNLTMLKHNRGHLERIIHQSSSWLLDPEK
jgi:hypothetical protein